MIIFDSLLQLFSLSILAASSRLFPSLILPSNFLLFVPKFTISTLDFCSKCRVFLDRTYRFSLFPLLAIVPILSFIFWGRRFPRAVTILVTWTRKFPFWMLGSIRWIDLFRRPLFRLNVMEPLVGLLDQKKQSLCRYLVRWGLGIACLIMRVILCLCVGPIDFVSIHGTWILVPKRRSTVVRSCLTRWWPKPSVYRSTIAVLSIARIILYVFPLIIRVMMWGLRYGLRYLQRGLNGEKVTD